jgi:hypothetical protein
MLPLNIILSQKIPWRKVCISLGVLLLLAALVSGIGIYYMSGIFGGDDIYVINEVESPDGKYKAMTFIHDYRFIGPTEELSVLPTKSAHTNKCGNAISGDALNEIKVRWIDNTHLAVHCEPHIPPFRSFWVGKVQLIYEYFLNEDIVELPSPNLRKKAVLFRLAKGAKGLDTKEVSLMDAKIQIPPNLGGNILSADKDSMITMHWVDDRHLNIKCTQSLISKSPLHIEGIEVSFN